MLHSKQTKMFQNDKFLLNDVKGVKKWYKIGISDTEEGTVSTNWTSSGNFGFQKNCLLADPLPGKLIFNIFLKYSQSQNISSNSDFQNSETVEYERELGWIEMSLFTLGFGFPQINGWYRLVQNGVTW